MQFCKEIFVSHVLAWLLVRPVGVFGPILLWRSSHLWPALAVLCVQEVLLSHVLLGLAACQCRLPIFVFAQVTVCRIPSLEFL